MSDWLMSDDGTGDDGGSYLGMDEPAMPDAAPAPPTAPAATATAPDPADDWLGGDSGGSAGNDDWLGGSIAAPAEGHGAGAAPDGQGDWITGSSGDADAAVVPGVNGQGMQQYAQPQGSAPAPMAMATNGELSVTAPQLHQVQPTRRTLGGAGTSATSELSNLVLDVEVQVEVGLGNAALTVEEFLEMGRGSVVELDTPIDAPIELKVRGKLIARGQLVSINGSYGMRIVEMLNEER
jgi:flagellar motor switch protein FliN